MISPSELHAFIENSYADADANLAVPPKRVIVPKKYTVTFGTLPTTGLAAGATASQTLQIGANGDFFLTRMSFSGNLAALTALTNNTAIIPQWRIQITDSGSDEQFFNGPVDLSSAANNAYGFPCDFRDEPYPRIIAGRSTLNIQVTSYETAAAYFVDFVFHGVLVKTFQ